MTRPVVYSRDTRHDAIKASIAFARSGSDMAHSREWAVARWGEAGAPVELTRAAQSSTTLNDIDSGQPLGDPEMFKTIRESSILLRLRGIRRTPLRGPRSVSIGTGIAASWVGEGKPFPILKPTFENTGLAPSKLAAGTIATKEALDQADGIEGVIYSDLAAALIDELDNAFLDPTNAGVSGVQPASITNGAPSVAATSDPEDDVANLVAAFEGDLRSAYFACSPAVAAGLAGEFFGRDIGARGGDLLGIPVLTARGAPEGVLALIDPTGVQAGYSDTVWLGHTEAGAIEMDSEPTQDQPTGTVLVSMFQNNLVAFKGVFGCAWKRARPGSVAVLTGLTPAAS